MNPIAGSLASSMCALSPSAKSSVHNVGSFARARHRRISNRLPVQSADHFRPAPNRPGRPLESPTPSAQNSAKSAHTRGPTAAMSTHRSPTSSLSPDRASGRGCEQHSHRLAAGTYPPSCGRTEIVVGSRPQSPTAARGPRGGGRLNGIRLVHHGGRTPGVHQTVEGRACPGSIGSPGESGTRDPSRSPVCAAPPSRSKHRSATARSRRRAAAIPRWRPTSGGRCRETARALGAESPRSIPAVAAAEGRSDHQDHRVAPRYTISAIRSSESCPRRSRPVVAAARLVDGSHVAVCQRSVLRTVKLRPPAAALHSAAARSTSSNESPYGDQ